MLGFVVALLPLEGGGNSSNNRATSHLTDKQHSPAQFTPEVPE